MGVGSLVLFLFRMGVGRLVRGRVGSEHEHNYQGLLQCTHLCTDLRSDKTPNAGADAKPYSAYSATCTLADGLACVDAHDAAISGTHRCSRRSDSTARAVTYGAARAVADGGTCVGAHSATRSDTHRRSRRSDGAARTSAHGAAYVGSK